MTISDFVRQKRKEYKLTQRDLADRAGVGIRFIRELEAGKPTLRIDKVNVVLDLFGHRLGPVPNKHPETLRGLVAPRVGDGLVLRRLRILRHRRRHHQ